MAARMCKVTVDGEIREYKAGTTYQEIAADFQPHYEHQIVLVFAGGFHLQELRKTLEKDRGCNRSCGVQEKYVLSAR